jgi:hypothetical protein
VNVEPIINIKTANGLTVSQWLHGCADEAIETRRNLQRCMHDSERGPTQTSGDDRFNLKTGPSDHDSAVITQGLIQSQPRK